MWILPKMGAITNTMFSTVLKELESKGIVTRVQFNEIPPHVEYSLIPVMKKLYENFVLQWNMVQLKAEKDWTYHGNGEYGERDWFHKDKQQYTYIFSDASGKSRAWLRFFFQPAAGLTDLYEASYRDGTRINANRDTLEKIFQKRVICS